MQTLLRVTGADAQVATAEPIQMHFGSTANLGGSQWRMTKLFKHFLFVFKEAKLPATTHLFDSVTKSHGPIG